MFGFTSCPPAVEKPLKQFLNGLCIEAMKTAFSSRNHPIAEALIKATKEHDLSQMSLREIAKTIGMPKCHPQRIKHHLQKISL